MVEVVGVHGIGQQQGGRNQLLAAWQPALADGIERAVGRSGLSAKLDLAYYGDLFLVPTATKKSAADFADLQFDDDTVAFFSAVEDEVVDEVPPPQATKGFKEVPPSVARLAAWLDRRFGVAGRMLFFGDLLQVRRYQRDDELAETVRGRVREAAGVSPRVLLGHSLGSVVAYEYLCLDPGHEVEALVTLGSPLALRSIHNDLRTLGPDGRPQIPPGVAWVNVYDPSDPVACAGGLSATWPTVVDDVVDNGSDPHAATHYLGKRQTGAAVAAALQR